MNENFLSANGVIASRYRLSRSLNVNAATRGELELLPGIGPALAGRIIDYRQQHGPLRGMGDLDKVRGIGPKLIERLRPLVRFE